MGSVGRGATIVIFLLFFAAVFPAAAQVISVSGNTLQTGESLSTGTTISLASTSSEKGGFGLSVQAVTTITTCGELQNMSNNLSGNYELGNDIDCSATESWNSGNGWARIGNYTAPFSGSINGSGFKISHLYMNRSVDSCGLLSVAHNISVIDVELSNFTVECNGDVGALVGYLLNSSVNNVSVSGLLVSNSADIGGLVAEADNSTISNVSVNARIYPTGGNWAGGLVGKGVGISIISSWYNGTINASGGLHDYFGGIIGQLTDGNISRVWSDGVVVGRDDDVGGVVGRAQNSTIANSFSLAEVHAGDDRLGGFVGSSTLTTIENSYSAGLVNTATPATTGGFSGGTILSETNCFWDNQTSDQSTSLGNCVGKSSSDMRDIATFTNTSTVGLSSAWDFVGDPNDDVATEDIWDINSSINNGYPYLKEFEQFYDASSPTPLFSKFNGSTTNFSAEGDLNAVSNATLEISGFGRIVWNSSVDVEYADFDSYVDIGERFIYVDSANLDSSLNSAANLTFYNIPWSTYTIYRDGVECSTCGEISFSGETLEIYVSGFSNYSINNSAPTHDIPVLNSSDDPYNRTNGDLNLYFENATDNESDNISFVYNWYVNGVSTTLLNLPFDVNSSNITDFSGYNNSVILGNGSTATEPLWSADGVTGGSYYFDGVDDFLEVPYNETFNSSVDAFSIEAWVRRDGWTDNWGAIVSKPRFSDSWSSPFNAFILSRNNNQDSLLFKLGFDSSTSEGVSGGTLQNDTWTHVVGTYDGSYIRLYIGGVLVASEIETRDLYFGDASNVYVGTNWNGSSSRESFPGYVDALKIYNVSLTADQVQQNYVEGNLTLGGQQQNQTLLDSDMTGVAQVWNATVVPVDRYNYGLSKTSNSLTIQENGVPTHDAPVLNASDNPFNRTTANLTAYVTNDADAEGDNLSVVTNWLVDNVSITLLNLAFDAELSSPLDFSSYNNGVTLGNGSVGTSPVWSADGVSGGSYYFDGVNDVLEVPYSETFNSSVDAFSIEAWVRRDGWTDDYGTVVSKPRYTDSWSSPYSAFLLGRYSNTDQMWLRLGFGPSAVNDVRGGALQNDTWTHVVGTYDGSYMRLYMDAQLVDSKVEERDLYFGAASTVYAGTNWNGSSSRESFPGYIDSLKIYNISLSADQVLQNFNEGNSTLNGADQNDSVIHYSMTDFTESWMAQMTLADSLGYSATKNSSSLEVANISLTQDQPLLNSTDSPTNSVNANLTVYVQNASNDYGEDMYFHYDWRINDTSIALLNLPFFSDDVLQVSDYSTYNQSINVSSVVAQRPQPSFDGVYGSSYLFDGSDDSLIISENNSIQNISGNFSMEFWMKRDGWGDSYATIVGKRYWPTSFTNPFWSFNIQRDNNGNDIVFVMATSNSSRTNLNSDGDIANDTWTHIVGIYDGTNMSLYINGLLNATTASTALDMGPGLNLTIGNNEFGGSESFSGNIDEVKIYDFALSSNQIYQNFLEGNASLAGNDYNSSNIVSNETSVSDVWTARVSPFLVYDRTNNLSTVGDIKTSNTLTITAINNSAPTHDTPTLVASDAPVNSVNANLTASAINGNDADGDNISWSFDWRLDGTSIALLNMPFNVNQSANTTGLILDLSSHGNNGTLGGGTDAEIPDWVGSCVIGGCFDFDGTDDWIDLGNDSSLQVTSNLSVAAWLRVDGGGGTYRTGVTRYDYGVNDRVWELSVDQSGRPYAWISGDGLINSQRKYYVVNTSIDDGAWHHFAWTFSSDNLTVYLNGTRIDDPIVLDNDTVNSLHQADVNLILGNLLNNGARANDPFNGALDEVYVFNRTLSQAQIAQLYDTGVESLDGAIVNTSVWVSDETSAGDNWSVSVTPSDGELYGESKTSNSVIISSNVAPTHDTPVLNASDDPLNYSLANLSVYSVNAADSNGDDIDFVVDWRLDGQSLAVLNIPMDKERDESEQLLDFSTFQNNASVPSSDPDLLASYNTTNCVSGGCYTFDKMDDYFVVPHTVDTQLENFTVSAWINAGDHSGAGFDDLHGGIVWLESYPHTGLYVYNNELRFTVKDAQVHANSVDGLGWQHVVGVKNGTDFSVYQNGQQEGTNNVSNSTMVYTETYIEIGNRKLNTTFNGSIDQVMLFSRPLSADQILQLFEEGNRSLNNLSQSNFSLLSNETSVSDVWTAAITPTDSTDYGATKISNSLTVQSNGSNSAPTHDTPLLNSSDTPINSTFADLVAYPVNGNDVDGDNISWSFDWRINDTSLALLYLPFDENISTNATLLRDLSSYNHSVNMTQPGYACVEPTYTTSLSVKGGAYQFEGDGTIAVTNNTAFHNMDQFSIAFWSKRNGTLGAQTIFQKSGFENSLKEGWRIQRGGGGVYNIEFFVDFGISENESDDLRAGVPWRPPFDDDEWIHWIVAWDGSNTTDGVSFYRNGQQVTTQSYNNASGSRVDDSSKAFQIGGEQCGDHWEGVLDEIYVFDRVISAEQAKFLFDLGNASLYNQTVSSANLSNFETGVSDNVTVAVTPSDSSEYGTTKTSNAVNIASTVPTHDTPILNASDDPTNSSNATLTAYAINTSDPQGDNIHYNFDWRIDGTSLAVINSPFDEEPTDSASPSTRDLSTFGNDGTLVDGREPVWEYDSTHGGAFRFNGSDDKSIEFGSSDSLDEMEELTVLVWAKPDSGGDVSLVEKKSSENGNSDGWRLGMVGETIIFRVAYDTQPLVSHAGYPITHGVWNLIGVTWSGGINYTTTRIYHDGQPETYWGATQDGIGTRVSDAPEDLRVGCCKTQDYNGTIGHVWVFDKALTDEQIATIYNQTASRYNRSSLNFSETRPGDNITVAVTPADEVSYGETKISNSLVISGSNALPTQNTPTLVASDDPENTTFADLTATGVGGNDSDGDDVVFNFDWRINDTSLALLHLPFDEEVTSNATLLTDLTTYSPAVNLTYDAGCVEPTYTISETARGGAYRFNNGGSIGVNDASYLDNLSQMSVAFWTKRDETYSTRETIIQKTGVQNQLSNGWRIERPGSVQDKVGFVVDYGVTSNSSDNLEAQSEWDDENVWTHWVITWDGTNSTSGVTFYEDGVLSATISNNEPIGSRLPSTTPVQIGGEQCSSSTWNGWIDEVLIFDFVLSADQAYNLYQPGNLSLGDYFPTNTSSLASEETSSGDVITAAVTPSDSVDYGATILTNNVTISLQSPPTHDTPSLVSSDDPLNYESANLTVTPQNAADLDGDNISWTFDWRLDGESFTLLNLPFAINESPSVLDASIFDHTVYSNRSPSWSSDGVYGGSMFFDGSEILTINASDSFDTVTSNFSIEFWMKRDAWGGPWSTLVGLPYESGTWDSPYTTYSVQRYSGTNDNIRFAIKTDGDTQLHSVASSSSIANDVWYHIVATYNQSQMRIYINGTLENTTVTNGTLETSNATAVYIGRNWNQTFNVEAFSGLLDEVKIYNRSLSAEQVYQNFYEGNLSLNGLATNTSVLVSNETTVGDNWSVSVTPSDQTFYGTSKTSNAITIAADAGLPPTHDAPVLNTTDSPSNLTAANLTAHRQNASDPDADPINWNYDWRLESDSIALVSLGFDVNGTLNESTSDGSNASFPGGSADPIFNSSGALGGAYTFDGSADYISLGTMDITGDELTIEAWVNADSFVTPDIRIASKATGTSANDHIWMLSTNDAGGDIRPRFRLNTGGSTTTLMASSGNMLVGTWYHVAAVYNSSHMIVYLNGSEVGSTAQTGNIATDNTMNADIGRNPGGVRYWDGGLDEVRIYDYALTPEQIGLHANKNYSVIDSSMTSVGENWSVQLTPNDQVYFGTSRTSNNLEILADPEPPTHDAPVLTASDDPINSENANLQVYPQNAVDPNGDTILYGYDWRLNQTSIALLNYPFLADPVLNSNNVLDLSTSELNGTNNGAAWISSGAIGGALNFTASESDDITVGTLSAPTEGSVSFFVSGRSDVTSTRRPFGIEDAFEVRWDSNDRMYFDMCISGAQSTFASTTTTWSGQDWYHIAATWNDTSDEFNVYVNGTLDNNGTFASIDCSGISGTLTVGRRTGNTDYYEGGLDEFMIFNRTLSAQQVASLAARNDVLTSNETAKGDVWSAAVTVSDGTDLGETKLSNNLTIASNSPPTHDAPIINSTDSPDNQSSANLTAYPQNGADADGDNISYSFDWRKDGTSLAVVHLPFDESLSSPSGQVDDLSTYKHNFTVFETSSERMPTFTTDNCVKGGCFIFEGNQSLEVDFNQNLNISYVTYSAWIKTVGSPGETGIIVFNSGGPFNKFVHSSVNGALVELQGTNSSQLKVSSGGGGYEDGVWHHFVATYDGSDIAVYVDGVKESNETYVGGPIEHENIPLRIGSGSTGPSSAGAYFNGSIDEVMVFDYALTTDQIYQIFLEGNASLYNQSLNTSTILSNETVGDDVWSVSVTPSDGVAYGASRTSGNVTILKSIAPTHDTSILNASDNPSNSSEANLTVYSQNGFDADGDNISWSFDWREDATSLAVLNLPFDENVTRTDSGTVNDLSTYQQTVSLGSTSTHGSCTAAPEYVLDPSGFGGRYNLESPRTIFVADDTSITNLSAMTIMLWVENDPAAGGGVLVQKASSNIAVNSGWKLWFKDNGLRFDVDYGVSADNNDDMRVFTDEISESTYSNTHLALTWNGSNSTDGAQFYINGSLATKESDVNGSGSRNSDSGEVLTIGGTNSCGANFNGTIDHVMVFDRVLSAEQIQFFYDQQAAQQSGSEAANQSLHSSQTSDGSAYTVQVTPGDGQEYGESKLSNSVSIASNYAPTHDTPIINASDNPLNTTDANVTGYAQNGVDFDGDNISWSFDWRENATSLAVLNLPFDENIISNVSGALTDLSSYNQTVSLSSTDFSGSCTETPDYQLSSGGYGGRYYFDEGPAIFVGDSASLQDMSELTVMLWSESGNAAGSEVIIQKANQNNNLNSGWRLFFGSGELRFGVDYGVSADSADDMIAGTDEYRGADPANTHVAVTWNGSNSTDGVNFYINGSSTSKISNNNGSGSRVSDVGQILSIGASNVCGKSYNGSIDNVLIFDRALSAEQIQFFYDQQAAQQSGSEAANQSLHSSQTSDGSAYTVQVTPGDGQEYGASKLSNSVTISSNVAPTHDTPVLNASDYPVNSTSANLTAYPQNGVDLNGDNISWSYDWRLNNESIATLYMPFDEQVTSAADGAVKDLSSFQRNGTLGGGNASRVPSWQNTDCVSGGCYDFGDNLTYLNLSAAVDDTANTQMTLAGWFKLNEAEFSSDGRGFLRGYNRWGLGYRYDVLFHSMRINGEPAPYYLRGSTALEPDTWYHTALTFNGSEKRIYLDGELEILNNGSNAEYITGTIMQVDTVYIGDDPSYDTISFNGSVDEVLIMNVSLTADQIYQLFLEGNASLNNQSLNTSTLVSNMTSPGDNWSVSVTPSDGIIYGESKTSNLVEISSNVAPTHDTPILNASDNPSNTTNANLTAYAQNGFDANSDNISWSFDWRINSTSLAMINLRFDEAVTTNASYAVTDLSTYGNNGTLANVTYDADCRPPQYESDPSGFGGLYRFDKDQAIMIENNPQLEGLNEFTILMWVDNDDDSITSTLVQKSGNPNNLPGGWRLHLQGGGLHFEADFNQTSESDDDLWSITNDYSRDVLTEHHIGVSWDGSNVSNDVRFYVNGSLATTQANRNGTNNWTNSSQPISIGGSRSCTRQFNGTIDNFMLFDSVLTPEQVQAIYAQQAVQKNGSASANATLVSQQTSGSDNWSVSVTPSDGTVYGESKLSNSVEIQDGGVDGAACSVNGDCVSNYCADSRYEGVNQSLICCSADSCAASGTCYADLATFGSSTCYDGVWIEDSEAQFAVTDSSGNKVFVVDVYGSVALSGLRNASCNLPAPSDAYEIDMPGSTNDVWINSSGYMCDQAATLDERRSSFFAYSSNTTYSITNSSGAIVFQKYGLGDGDIDIRGDFVDQVGSIS